MAKRCYFQDCKDAAVTKEHIPPRAFFPLDKRHQLITVPACEAHNNDKSEDDQYVLAHVCLNASPINESREIFMEKIAPQLGFNNDALRKLLRKDARILDSGAVAYRVDVERFDRFFDALSFGLVYTAAKKECLPARYSTEHVYHDFEHDQLDATEGALHQALGKAYKSEGQPLAELNFGQVQALNKTIYSVRIFGAPRFTSSITIAHTFFGSFRVTSMLSTPWPSWLAVPWAG